MSRVSRAKDFKDELRQLFGRNVSEMEAYEKVKDDDRFDNVRLSKISTFYQQFRSLEGKKPSTEIFQRSEQLVHFQLAQEECDHKKMECLKFWNYWMSGCRFSIVLNRMPINGSARNSILRDVLNNKACRIAIPTIKMGVNYEVYSLTQEFALLVEYTDNDGQNNFSEVSLSLLEYDWFDKKIRKIQTFSFEDQQRRFVFQSIIVDTMDPTRFLLRNWHRDNFPTFKFGRVQNSELLIGDEIPTMNRNIQFGEGSLVGNTLYSFNSFAFVRSNQPCMYVTQFGQEVKTSEFGLSPLPERFATVNGEFSIIGDFAMARLYLAVQHNETKRYGIVWISHETQTWETINFDTEQAITRMEFIVDGHILLVQTTDYESELTSDVHQIQSTFYRIPLKKPEKLSILAWSSLVRSKRKLNVADPYEEARNYLPYNSQIRCPFEE